MQVERVALERGVALGVKIPLVDFFVNMAAEAVKMFRVGFCTAARSPMYYWYLKGGGSLEGVEFLT